MSTAHKQDSHTACEKNNKKKRKSYLILRANSYKLNKTKKKKQRITG